MSSKFRWPFASRELFISFDNIHFVRVCYLKLVIYQRRWCAYISFIRFAIYFLSTAYILFAYIFFCTPYLRLLHFILPYLHINVYIYVYKSIYGVLLVCTIMLPRSLCQFFALLFFKFSSHLSLCCHSAAYFLLPFANFVGFYVCTDICT